MEENSTCPVPEGILMLIGGKESKDGEPPKNHEIPEGYDPLTIMKTFTGLIENKDAGVEVITSGSSEDVEGTFNEYRKIFNQLGIAKVNHVHHERRGDITDDFVERIRNTGAVFFAGGDQLTLTALYGGTEFLKELKERYIRERIVIAGTSAGAMAMSTPMIYAGSKEVEQLGGEIKVTTGLEFLKDVCVDTHFVHRGRFVRMAQVLATNPTCVGVGIDEDSAMIVQNGTDAEMVGSGIIIVLEGFNIAYTNIDQAGKKQPVSIRDITVHLLAQGDKYKIPQMNPPHQ